MKNLFLVLLFVFSVSIGNAKVIYDSIYPKADNSIQIGDYNKRFNYGFFNYSAVTYLDFVKNADPSTQTGGFYADTSDADIWLNGYISAGTGNTYGLELEFPKPINILAEGASVKIGLAENLLDYSWGDIPAIVLDSAATAVDSA